MAEWLSTDLFHGGIATAGGNREDAGASFGPIETALANRAQDVQQPTEKKQGHKRNSEEQFGSDKFLNKIQLQHEQNEDSQNTRGTHFRIRNQLAQHWLQLAGDRPEFVDDWPDLGHE
jgi:hypothetical protein